MEIDLDDDLLGEDDDDLEDSELGIDYAVSDKEVESITAEKGPWISRTQNIPNPTPSGKLRSKTIEGKIAYMVLVFEDGRRLVVK